MKRTIFAAMLGAAVLGAGLPMVPRAAVAAPEPSRTPLSWDLGFRYGPMERIFVTLDGKQQTYWFMRYTVTNKSGREILYTPSFELVGDTGTVLEAFKEANGKDNIPDAVFEAISFPALDPDARKYQLFAMGLSGETAAVKNPVTGKSVILQKTLEIDFNLPGQAIGIEPKTEFTAVKWVMK
jgi:hypothetical protein